MVNKSLSDFRIRATQLFEMAREQIKQDCDVMHANHSAESRLGSGDTAIAAIEIYEKRMSEALNQLLSEVAKVINHRGRAWTRTMTAIRDVLQELEPQAEHILAASFKLARVEGKGGARKAVNELLAKCARNLLQELEGFNLGWTSPSPQRWTERYPIIYAVFLVVLGALISALVQQLWPKPVESHSNDTIAKAPRLSIPPLSPKRTL